jgi:hypothetical protein
MGARRGSWTSSPSLRQPTTTTGGAGSLSQRQVHSTKSPYPSPLALFWCGCAGEMWIDPAEKPRPCQRRPDEEQGSQRTSDAAGAVLDVPSQVYGDSPDIDFDEAPLCPRCAPTAPTVCRAPPSVLCENHENSVYDDHKYTQTLWCARDDCLCVEGLLRYVSMSAYPTLAGSRLPTWGRLYHLEGFSHESRQCTCSIQFHQRALIEQSIHESIVLYPDLPP